MGEQMKRFSGLTILLLAVFAAAGVQPAAAQSTPNWVGFYIGANAGAGLGEFKNDIAFMDPAGPFNSFHSTGTKPNAFIAGGQLGYNWQVSPMAVLGLETDWQNSSASSGQSYADFIRTFIPLGPGFANDTINTTYQAKISWLGTLRGRIGFVRGNFLFYGTGGVAYGRIGISGTASEVADFSGAGGGIFSSTTPFNVTQTKAGWTLGAGIEGSLAGKWSWKAEYLYVDLGSISGSFAGPLIPGETVTVKSRFDENLLRLGVNYRLN
jgi:outer membrane immunogenic protein